MMEDELREKIKDLITSYPGGTSLLRDKTKDLKPPDGYSMRYINMILSGDRQNDVILDLAVDVAGFIIRENQKRVKAEERKRKKQIAKLKSLQAKNGSNG